MLQNALQMENKHDADGYLLYYISIIEQVDADLYKTLEAQLSYENNQLEELFLSSLCNMPAPGAFE